MNSIIICGHEGRMGQSLFELLEGHASFSKPTIFKPDLKKPIGQSVLIDFSSPEGFRASLDWCVKSKVPFVSGTTGLSAADFELLNQAAKTIATLWASNMSLGIQWMKSVMGSMGALKNDFEFQIEEIHHSRKKDSPSGTALDLHKTLNKELKKETAQPLAIRGGGVFGIHRLFVLGEEETITIEHQALNRKVFARGALRAAEYLIGKPAGRFEMNQVLGL